MPVGVEEIYDRFDADLRAFVRAQVRDLEAAEDLLQDVYLKIHSHVGAVRDEEKVVSWVYRIARNAVNDHYRARRRPATRELEDASSEPPDPTGDELGSRLSKAVREMLEALPPDHREALYLTEYEGLSQRELAGRLGIGVSGAKSRVQRARTRLKAMLLDCCHFELDRRGGVINYYGRQPAHDDPGSVGEDAASDGPTDGTGHDPTP